MLSCWASTPSAVNVTKLSQSADRDKQFKVAFADKQLHRPTELPLKYSVISCLIEFPRALIDTGRFLSSSSVKMACQPEKIDQLYVLMTSKYRVSRNTRAHWFFNHLNQIVKPSNKASIVSI